jgi:phosphoribosylformylglycinamidine synthase subunit PurQ / glutaminase
MSRIGVVTFPGSNCDQDCLDALRGYAVEAVSLWHRDTSLQRCDAVILPGGFSYGDYLRCGAIARFSPIMDAIRSFAADGGLVIGICNGFQILAEAGLLPGSLLQNAGRRFICRHVTIRVESTDRPLTRRCSPGQVLTLPIAHSDGRYWTTPAQLAELARHDQILFRYAATDGRVTAEANPNGAADNIAGICNLEGNVFGMMPHPERAVDPLLGGTDGRRLFDSLLEYVAVPARASVAGATGPARPGG